MSRYKDRYFRYRGTPREKQMYRELETAHKGYYRAIEELQSTQLVLASFYRVREDVKNIVSKYGGEVEQEVLAALGYDLLKTEDDGARISFSAPQESSGAKKA